MSQIEARTTFQLLHPTMRERVKDLMTASGGAVGLGEGHRSEAVQRAMFLSRYVPDPDGPVFFEGKRWKKLDPRVATAAPPGRSMHELGLACDLVGDLGFVGRECASFGLKNFANVNDEPWHVQPLELPNSRQEYERAGASWAKKTGIIDFKPKRVDRPEPTTPPEVLPGERSDVVRELQDVLVRLNLIRDTPENHDGHYGLATQKVVKAFQRANGLVDDAKVGPKTWRALLDLDPISPNP